MGYRIREFREAQKTTQDELAKKSGVSRGTISAMENGDKETTTKTLIKIARALGTSVDSIFLTMSFDQLNAKKGGGVLGNYKVAEDVSQERQKLEFRVNEIYGMLLRCQEVINTMHIIICYLFFAWCKYWGAFDRVAFDDQLTPSKWIMKMSIM